VHISQLKRKINIVRIWGDNPYNYSTFVVSIFIQSYFLSFYYYICISRNNLNFIQKYHISEILKKDLFVYYDMTYVSVFCVYYCHLTYQ